MVETKLLDCQFFRDKGACYDPATVLGEKWEGTIVDILKHEKVPAKDKIWAACQVMTDKELRLFAVRSIRETPLKKGGFVIDLITDERSLNAIKVAEDYAIGIATQEQLDAAWDAAWDAARAAARAAAVAAARAAAVDAAWAAAMAAAMAAAWDAAWAAARAAAGDAACDAAMAAAGDAAGDAQVSILINMLSYHEEN